MSPDPLPLAGVTLPFLAGALVAALLVYGWFSLRLQLTLRRERREAISASRATLLGQVGEQLAPLLPEFPYTLEDARFLGAPIDYVVFDGHSEGAEVEVVFVEVKTGNAKLSRGERAIRDAIVAGRVRFETLRL
ncbi:MAG: Holliday junction resolvase-like protein [Myxococcota bacterium]